MITTDDSVNDLSKHIIALDVIGPDRAGDDGLQKSPETYYLRKGDENGAGCAPDTRYRSQIPHKAARRSD
jgi:hypothetical protein